MDIATPSYLHSVLSIIPKKKEGRQAKGAKEIYERELRDWANGIRILASRLDFQVSARGWCYIFEQHGLDKSDAEAKITECRKAGYLPLDICAEDTRRMSRGLKDIDDEDCEEYAASIFRGVDAAHTNYKPFSFWDDKEFYIEMFVEKIDLVSLFEPACRKSFIPIKDNVGWNDINSRARTMKRFARHAAEGRKCVLLYAGDFDPSGLLISKSLHDNMKELEGAVNMELAEDKVPDINMDDVIIDRFGLNYDFIIANRLSWISGLGTGSGKRLDDVTHKDHYKPYVQGYLRRYCPDWIAPSPPPTPHPVGTGARKCEANALVAEPKQGRRLCLQTILKYLSPRDPARYHSKLKEPREELRLEIMKREFLRATMTPPGAF